MAQNQFLLKLYTGKDFSVLPQLVDLAVTLTEKYGLPTRRSTRLVWRTHSGKFIKLPRCANGELDNELESSITVIGSETSASQRARSLILKETIIIIADKDFSLSACITA